MDEVAFFQWALPRLHMRWRGFRNVRGQVKKRIVRRMHALGVDGWAAYAAHLEQHADEWAVLDSCCRVTISRFYRDHQVFDHLAGDILPALARGGGPVRLWSAGCASGEEPYTLAMVWKLRVEPAFPGVRAQIIATDIDPVLLARAAAGVYASGTLVELTADLRDAAFEPTDGDFRVRPEIRAAIEFRCEDLRQHQPDGPFHVILCRNLAFTYFDASLQQTMLTRFAERLAPGGVLVVGRHEALPAGATGWTPWNGDRALFVRS
jgi:chemotaxis protein methyltransferase CheR